MAPIPPFLIRLATVFLTQVLTRRLQQSPTFFRAVDRLIHEIDHLPHRMNGKAVPYRRIDPHEPTISERAQDAWNHQMEDPGEPHDLTDPFAKPDEAKPKAIEGSNADRSRQPRRAAQVGTDRTETWRQSHEADKMDEMKSILERLREDSEKRKQQ